jgi:hypothetical protein
VSAAWETSSGSGNSTNGRNELGYNILDQELIQATVREFIEDPEQVLAAQAADPKVEASDCWKVDQGLSGRPQMGDAHSAASRT